MHPINPKTIVAQVRQWEPSVATEPKSSVVKRSARTVNSYQEIPTTTFSCAAQVPQNSKFPSACFDFRSRQGSLPTKRPDVRFAFQPINLSYLKSMIQFQHRVKIWSCRFSTTASLADASTPSFAQTLLSSTSSTLCVTGEPSLSFSPHHHLSFAFFWNLATVLPCRGPICWDPICRTHMGVCQSLFWERTFVLYYLDKLCSEQTHWHSLWKKVRWLERKK